MLERASGETQMSLPQEEPAIESRMVFRGRLINVRIDSVRLPNGNIGQREIVEHGGSVAIVPLDEHNNVLLVGQYRRPPEQVLLEVPAGGIDEGESPEDAVHRELQEETGYTAGRLQHLASFWMSPGFCTEKMHAFLATELKPGPPHQEEDENIQVEQVPLDKVLQLIQGGEIVDAKSIAFLLLAVERLRAE